MSRDRRGARPQPTSDPRATPFGARRGYVRTITWAMAVLVALAALWGIIGQFVVD